MSNQNKQNEYLEGFAKVFAGSVLIVVMLIVAFMLILFGTEASAENTNKGKIELQSLDMPCLLHKDFLNFIKGHKIVYTGTAGIFNSEGDDDIQVKRIETVVKLKNSKEFSKYTWLLNETHSCMIYAEPYEKSGNL